MCNISNIYIIIPSINIIIWSRHIQVICPPHFYQLISALPAEAFNDTGITCKKPEELASLL